MEKFKPLHSVPQLKFPSDLRRWASLKSWCGVAYSMNCQGKDKTMTIEKKLIACLFGVFLCCFVLLTAMNVAQASNINVQKTQQILKDLGYQPGPVDGLFGAKTRAALLQYQEDNSLPKTGEIDKATAKALGVAVVAQNNKEGSSTYASAQQAQSHTIYRSVGLLDFRLPDSWKPLEGSALREAKSEFSSGMTLSQYETGTVNRSRGSMNSGFFRSLPMDR